MDWMHHFLALKTFDLVEMMILRLITGTFVAYVASKRGLSGVAWYGVALAIGPFTALLGMLVLHGMPSGAVASRMPDLGPRESVS